MSFSLLSSSVPSVTVFALKTGNALNVCEKRIQLKFGIELITIYMILKYNANKKTVLMLCN